MTPSFQLERKPQRTWGGSANGLANVGSSEDYQGRSTPWPSFLEEPLVSAVTGRAHDEFLFPSSRGRALHVRNVRRVRFTAAAVAAGVPGLTPHERRQPQSALPFGPQSRCSRFSGCSDTVSPASPWMPTRTCLTRISRCCGGPDHERQICGTWGPTADQRGSPQPAVSRCNPLTCDFFCAPETIRTSDTRFRRAVLYPLSYEGPPTRTGPPRQGQPTPTRDSISRHQSRLVPRP